MKLDKNTIVHLNNKPTLLKAGQKIKILPGYHINENIEIISNNQRILLETGDIITITPNGKYKIDQNVKVQANNGNYLLEQGDKITIIESNISDAMQVASGAKIAEKNKEQMQELLRYVQKQGTTIFTRVQKIGGKSPEKIDRIADLYKNNIDNMLATKSASITKNKLGDQYEDHALVILALAYQKIFNSTPYKNLQELATSTDMVKKAKALRINPVRQLHIIAQSLSNLGQNTGQKRESDIARWIMKTMKESAGWRLANFLTGKKHTKITKDPADLSTHTDEDQEPLVDNRVNAILDAIFGEPDENRIRFHNMENIKSYFEKHRIKGFNQNSLLMSINALIIHYKDDPRYAFAYNVLKKIRDGLGVDKFGGIPKSKGQWDVWNNAMTKYWESGDPIKMLIVDMRKAIMDAMGKGSAGATNQTYQARVKSAPDD